MEDSYLPDLLDLAAAHGTRVLFIQLPVQAGWRRSSVSGDLRRSCVETLNDAPHAGFISLSVMAIPPNGFAEAHLSTGGQRLFMDALKPLLDLALLTDLRCAQGTQGSPRAFDAVCSGPGVTLP